MSEIQEARNIWEKTISHKGGHCPVCDKWGKINGWSFNASMAKSLIWLTLAPNDKDGWVDVPKDAPRWLVRSNQLPTVERWKLIERKPSDSTKLKHKGLWRPTQRGIDFSRSKIQIPSKVWVYNNSIQGFSDEWVSIKDCFQTHFHYEDALRAMFVLK
jgi:hypothetical protein